VAIFYRSIEGRHDFEDVCELALRRCGAKPARFEVGAYKGRSTCFLAERIRELSVAVELDAVDTLEADANAGRSDLWPFFAGNLEQASLLSQIVVHKRSSIEAASGFGDRSARSFGGG